MIKITNINIDNYILPIYTDNTNKLILEENDFGAFVLQGYTYTFNNKTFDPDYIVKIQPGMIDFTTSRESIDHTERTKNLIDKIKTEVNKKLLIDYLDEETIIEIIKKYKVSYKNYNGAYYNEELKNNKSKKIKLLKEKTTIPAKKVYIKNNKTPYLEIEKPQKYNYSLLQKITNTEFLENLNNPLVNCQLNITESPNIIIENIKEEEIQEIIKHKNKLMNIIEFPKNKSISVVFTENKVNKEYYITSLIIDKKDFTNYVKQQKTKPKKHKLSAELCNITAKQIGPFAHNFIVELNDIYKLDNLTNIEINNLIQNDKVFIINDNDFYGLSRYINNIIIKNNNNINIHIIKTKAIKTLNNKLHKILKDQNKKIIEVDKSFQLNFKTLNNENNSYEKFMINSELFNHCIATHYNKTAFTKDFYNYIKEEVRSKYDIELLDYDVLYNYNEHSMRPSLRHISAHPYPSLYHTLLRQYNVKKKLEEEFQTITKEQLNSILELL